MFRLTVILVFLTSLSYGQVKEYNLDLKVVESSDAAISDVPYATIYIKETNQEVQTDKMGEAILVLKKGTYTLYISSLGMEEKEMIIEIKSNSFNMVQLTPEGSDLKSIMGTTTSASTH